MNVKCPFDLKVMISANKYKRQCKFKINFVILLFYTYSYTSYNPKKKKKKKNLFCDIFKAWNVKGTFTKFFVLVVDFLLNFISPFYTLQYFFYKTKKTAQ